MGMQQFIENIVTLHEIEQKNLSKCPSCGREEKCFFRNLLGTLECVCGLKFYNQKISNNRDEEEEKPI